MKKILALLFVLLPLGAAAQGLAVVDSSVFFSSDSLTAASSVELFTPAPAASQHIHFKKIPVDGPLKEFTGLLAKDGFTLVGSRDGVGILEGRFAGIDDVKVYVYSSGDLVWKVIAVFPGQDTWTSMKRQYMLFKRSLANKYLVQPRSTEYFPVHNPEGVGREHNAFKEETAVWQSVFSLSTGNIILSVRPVLQGTGKMCLRLEYEDELNQILKDNAFLEDL